ncbi:maleylpyruvate isomerase N-terminal domain-containing protein [Streptacidiphilus sp. N1-3]|uniref:Maleylpyruvate isomerase N-terminal domain-containing protein n=1 Tax=Streptacidiphilus alkalitolerans TaxID=3342712 RepID=A0ABV6WXL0_9ACTN
MGLDGVMDGFRAEARALGRAVAGLTGEQWGRPTGCAPWSVADLFAHTSGAVDRLPGMLAEQPPERAEVSAADYYRPDARFLPEVNALRIAAAQQHSGGPALVEALLLGPEGDPAHLAALGWDRSAFLAKATGRLPLSAEESATVDRLGLTWLTLG